MKTAIYLMFFLGNLSSISCTFACKPNGDRDDINTRNIQKIICNTKHIDISPLYKEPPKGSKNPHLFNEYTESIFFGIVRSLAGIPIEHPVELIKTRIQANNNSQSIIKTIHVIYHNGGLKDFYRGLTPNTIRLVSKQCYRWPMITMLPKIYENTFPEHTFKDSALIKKILTGSTIASFEAIIINPLERLKIWMITNNADQRSLNDFYKQNKNNLIKELFRGLNASYPRQLITWNSFLVADDKVRTMARLHYNIKYNNRLPFDILFMTSFTVGFINGLFTIPFDYLQTQLQKYDVNEKGSCLKIAKNVFKTQGVKGFYVGGTVGLTQYILQATFTMSFLDFFENQRHLRHNKTD